LIEKYPENESLRTAECHNEIRRELANCIYQNQKESKYLDTLRAATEILIDRVGNYQPLKDDDVPCWHYISSESIFFINGIEIFFVFQSYKKKTARN